VTPIIREHDLLETPLRIEPPFAYVPQGAYLRPGDVVTLGIGNLGQQRQVVVAWSATIP
jgi:hypothetical protein